MSEWKEYKLGEIVKLIGGGTPNTTNSNYWGGDIPWLSVGDFNKGRKYVYDAEKHITQEGLNNSSTKILHKEDIIISARGTVGVVAMIGREMAFNQSCYGVRGKELIDQQYLYYLLIHSVQGLKQNAYGGVFDTITRETFDLIDVSLPPIDEQKRIAGVLSSLDDKIDLLNRENATLEALAETIFRHYFIENPDPTWKEGKLGDYVKTTSGGTPSRKQSKYYTTGTIDWVKSKELNGTFIFDTEEKITEEAVYNSSAKFLPANSVLIAMYGATVGEYGILAHSMTCNQAVCALLPNDNYPYTYLLGWAICYKQDLINLATGAAQQNISQDLIKQQMVCTDYELIRIYDEQIKPYIAKIKSNQQQIQTLTTQRDTLLPCLISGEVKVKGQ